MKKFIFILLVLLWFAASLCGAVITGMNLFPFFWTPGLLLLSAAALLMHRCRNEWIFFCGLAATIIGDYFLVYQGYGPRSTGFYGGVAGFSLAHLLYTAYFYRTGSFAKAMIPAALFPALLVLWCCIGHIPGGVLSVLVLYGTISAISLAGAVRAASRWFAAAVGMLFVSDICIAANWLNAPFANEATGILYVSSLGAAACAMAFTAFSRGRK